MSDRKPITITLLPGHRVTDCYVRRSTVVLNLEWSATPQEDGTTMFTAHLPDDFRDDEIVTWGIED